MDLSILDNGTNLEKTKKAMEFRYGQMAQNMKVIGIKVKLKAKVDLYLLTEKFMRETGLMIKHTAMGSTSIRMELFMKGSGIMTNKKEKALRRGQMVRSLKETTKMGKRED